MATILIVDDQPANRKSLAELLRSQQHRLVEAANGREALSIVEAEQPHLVITDVLMPVMDGYEFVRRLRENQRTARVPVLFYTAPYGAREARDRALVNGVPYVLTKPPEPSEVLRIVDQVLSGSAAPASGEQAASQADFNRDQLRLITDELSQTTDDLRFANTRLRALINIGLELSSARNTDQLLQRVCAAAHDLFGASYVKLGIVAPDFITMARVAMCGVPPGPWSKPGAPMPGFLTTVVRERRAVRATNAGGDPAGLQLPPDHPPVHSYLAAPIASPSVVYGWICLVGLEGQTFDQDDEDLVMALSGQVGRIYELEHEIAERIEAEAALREERDRSQRYLDTAGVILVALDREGKITLINRYGSEVLGWTAAELMGRDWIDTCLPPRLRETLRASLTDLMEGDLTVIVNPILRRDGSERLFEWHNTVLRDEEGRITGSLSSGADITERNQAAEALRIAEERMRFTLQNTGVGIWDMDFVTGKLRCSETLEVHYGLAPGSFGDTFEAFNARVHPEDLPELLATIKQAQLSGEDFTTQHRALQPDGSVRWLSGAGRFHLDDHGRLARGVGISLDITERRTLEAQYLQAQKMEAVGRLAGGIAHDFNNLLTAILGNCEMMLADLTGTDPHRNDIAEIQKAGNSAAALTRQLLTFSRKEITQPVVLDLNTVVADLRAMLGRLIGEDIHVVVGPAGRQTTNVLADRGEIEQVVMNLALNARDAMPKGGTLTINVAAVELDEAFGRTHLAVTPGPYVALTVSDTGTGMTPEVQARLFEPFFTTKEAGKGTGLGLATVHGIVTRSGGSVNVYSEVGRGTSFKLYFPRVGEHVAPAAAAAAPASKGTQTVLVVEDVLELRELTRRMLERQGYTVLLAASAEAAVLLFEQHQEIDVLLTDVVMPGASGPELTRELMERRPGLRVVYMSGYTEDAIVHHGVRTDEFTFLHKPFTAQSLGESIQLALTRAPQPPRADPGGNPPARTPRGLGRTSNQGPPAWVMHDRRKKPGEPSPLAQKGQN